jgi:hypothetical protein
MGSAPYYYQPVAPASVAVRGQQGESFAVYAAAAVLVGAVASLSTVGRDRRQAVAELDVDSATSAATVAMLAVKGGRKPVKKGAKKAEGSSPFSFGFNSGSVKPTGRKTTGRQTAGRQTSRRGEPAERTIPNRGSTWPGKSTELTFAGEVVATLIAAPFRLVKAFFSEENWLVQAVTLVAGLPEANKKEKPGARTNTQNGNF